MAYTKLQDFVKDIVLPQIKAIDLALEAERKERIEADALLSARIDNTGTDLTAHITNKNNPHSVKLQQMATISTFPPVAGTGQPGDVHIQLLP